MFVKRTAVLRPQAHCLSSPWRRTLDRWQFGAGGRERERSIVSLPREARGFSVPLGSRAGAAMLCLSVNPSSRPGSQLTLTSLRARTGPREDLGSDLSDLTCPLARNPSVLLITDMSPGTR